MALPLFVALRGSAAGVPVWVLAAAGAVLIGAAGWLGRVRWRRAGSVDHAEFCARFLQMNDRLEESKDRAFELFHTQMAASKKRTAQRQKMFELSNLINSELDLEHVLQSLVNAIRECLGYRLVLLRILDDERSVFRARAFAGMPQSAISRLERYEVTLDEFESWIQERFRVSNSYFISHEWNFWSKEDDELAYVPNLGDRREGEWHQDDVLFVPMRTREGKLIAYLSVDDPADHRLPTLEIIEMLELFANQGATAIQNAQLYRRLEEHMHQVRATAERMRELNELKSNFVSTVSHELRTPLTSIRAYVETLLDSGEAIDSPTRQEFLGIINDESARLARLIDAVLDLSKLEAGKLTIRREKLLVRTLVEEVLDVIRPMAEKKKLRLESSVTPQDLEVDADHDLMKQVFLNLYGNAIKFTPEGGCISIRAALTAGGVEIAVEDTGIGIPEDKLDQVFDRFYQVDGSAVRRFGGSGLGLAITKNIVEWHGGDIRAESGEGQGTRFVIVIGERAPSTAPIVQTVAREAGLPDAVVRAMISMVAAVLDARVVSFLVLEDDRLTLAIRAAVGIDEQIVRDVRVPVGEGVSGWVAQHGKEILVPDIEADPRFAGKSSPARYETRSLLSVPVRWAGEVIGVINVNNKANGQPLNDDDMRLLVAVAERIGKAWDFVARGQSHGRARLVRECFAAQEEHAIRARKRLHSGTLTGLAHHLAEKLGFGPSTRSSMVYAAAMHDIGMGFISEAALSGERQEFPEELLRGHTEAGARILRAIEVSPEVLAWTEAHHERMDGLGYPAGLAGDEIPLGARALAVLDAFEILTVGRPQAAPMSAAEAIDELRRGLGTQFDAGVIDALEQALAAMEATNVAPAALLSEGGSALG